MNVAHIKGMRTRCASVCQLTRALVLVWLPAFVFSGCADGDAISQRSSDGSRESCELPCNLTIAACIESESDQPLDNASVDVELVVKSVGGAHPFGAGARCFGLNVERESLVSVGLADDDGSEWSLAFSEGTLPSNYFRVGQRLRLHYEDGKACIFGGSSRLLTVEDAGELVLFVMHDDQTNGLAVPGFELTVGDALCEHDGSCGSVPMSTLATSGGETVQNACATNVAGFTLTQTFQAFSPGTSPLCDGCSHFLAAGYRRR